MYNSVGFSIFTRSCKHHHYLIPGHSHYPQIPFGSPYSLAITPHIVSQPLANTSLLSFSMDFCIFLDISYKGNPQSMVFCVWLLYVAYFKVHLCCSLNQYFIFMAGYCSIFCIYHISFFIYPLMNM